MNVFLSVYLPWEVYHFQMNTEKCADGLLKPLSTVYEECVGLLVLSLCVMVSPDRPVWSLGEGQAPEDLDKPVDTPPLSSLLIERPQGGSITVGECLLSELSSHSCSRPEMIYS